MDFWNDPDFWINLGFSAFVAILGFLGRHLLLRSERKRTEEIRQASFYLGMTFLADNEDLVRSFSAVPLFQESRSKKAKNVLRGRSGDREEVLFDFENKTIAAFRLSADLPRFSMCPEGILDKIGERFGMQDIDFETDQEFSRDYRLRGKEEAAIRELFRPLVLKFFTQEIGWYLEGGAGWLLIYQATEKKGPRVAPQDLSAFLQQTRRIAHIFGEEPATESASAPFWAEEIQTRGQGLRPSLVERRAGFFLVAFSVLAFIASMQEAAWTGGYTGSLLLVALLLSWLGLASVIQGTGLVKYGGGFLVTFFAFAITVVFLSSLHSESSEPTPEEITPPPATPSGSEIAVRVSAWVDPESRELLPSDAEVWFQGHGSLWLSRDPVKILGKRPPGQTQNLHIYPDGRDGKKIVVPITMTADMCPQGCDRDTILINISDDLVEVVGNAVKNRSAIFRRR